MKRAAYLGELSIMAVTISPLSEVRRLADLLRRCLIDDIAVLLNQVYYRVRFQDTRSVMYRVTSC